ncbi:MAG TPA: hypothetical protein VM243_08415 [Phycisphaerae bacterium]|nr:hypothetical protein [Phycisphaerae bacterium]
MAHSHRNNGRDKRRPWTPGDDAIVRAQYPDGGPIAVNVALDARGREVRTPNAIQVRAVKLGVHRVGYVSRRTRADVLHTTPPPRRVETDVSTGTLKLAEQAAESIDIDRIRTLKTDELFRVARATRIAMAESLRDFDRFMERWERVFSEILHRIERATTCGGANRTRGAEAPEVAP